MSYATLCIYTRVDCLPSRSLAKAVGLSLASLPIPSLSALISSTQDGRVPLRPSVSASFAVLPLSSLPPFHLVGCVGWRRTRGGSTARRENPRRRESEGEKGRSVPKMEERRETGKPMDKGQQGGCEGLGDSCRPCEGPSTRPGRLPRNTPRAPKRTIARERGRERT